MAIPDAKLELDRLIGSWFNQDWNMEAPSIWELIPTAVEGTDANSIEPAATQLRGLLESCETEADLEASVTPMGWEIDLPRFGSTYADYLARLQLALGRAAQQEAR